MMLLAEIKRSYGSPTCQRPSELDNDILTRKLKRTKAALNRRCVKTEHSVLIVCQADNEMPLDTLGYRLLDFHQRRISVLIAELLKHFNNLAYDKSY